MRPSSFKGFTCKCVCSADPVLMSTGDEPEVLQRGGHGLPGQRQDRHQDAGRGKHRLQQATAVANLQAQWHAEMVNEYCTGFCTSVVLTFKGNVVCSDLRPLGPAAHCQSHGEAPVREWAAHHHARGAWRPLLHRTRGEFTPASP